MRGFVVIYLLYDNGLRVAGCAGALANPLWVCCLQCKQQQQNEEEDGAKEEEKGGGPGPAVAWWLREAPATLMAGRR